MSAASRLGVHGEFVAAALVGSKRVRRKKYESTPDVEPVQLKSGRWVQPEAKSSKKISKRLRGGLEQARAYKPGCLPMVILYAPGMEALAVVPLKELAIELGLVEAPAQLDFGPQPAKS